MGNRLEDADGGVQLEVCPIHHFLVPHERYHTSSSPYIVCTQLGELLGQDRFQSHERLGDEFEFLFHC